MALLAVRLIDLAIFASLGGLWIGGAVFIVVLYRWIIRYEHAQGIPSSPEPVEAVPAPEPEPAWTRDRNSSPRTLPASGTMVAS